MARYKHLYRDKWLDTKVQMLSPAYYEDELTIDDQRVFDVCPRFLFHEIIFSNTDPNIRTR